MMSGVDLAALLPGIHRHPEVTVHEHSLLPSFNVTPTFMLELSHVTAALLDAGADGIVISHGTDTLEETAFWLDLTLDIGMRRAPVVLTGAMRHNSQIGADGPRNLFDAVTVAAHGLDGCLAPMVVANGQIHAARHVVKTDSFNVATFQSVGAGPVGHVFGQEVAYARCQVPARQPLAVLRADARVPLLKWAAGMDDLLLRACLDAAVDGVVIEGFGLGHVPGAVVPAIAALRSQNIPVVMTTRCLSGPTLPTVYGGAGAGPDMLELGVIFARHLPGPQARLLLIAALGTPIDQGNLAALFTEG